MLKIFQSKHKKKSLILQLKEGDYAGVIKHYSPSNNEWVNSIYGYNKEYSKLLPIWDKIIVTLIKGYFNMQQKKFNSKLKVRRLRYRWKKKSPRKVWVSKPELKHTTNKVIINLFIYDRNKKFLLLKTNKIYKTFIRDRINKFFNEFKIIKSRLFTNTWKYIFSYYKNINLQYHNFIKSYIYKNKIRKIHNELKRKKLNFVRKTLKKEMLIMFYKQVILFNNMKLKNVFMLPLVNLLAKIYKKKVILNVVSLKYYFLNSDILTQMIVYKLKNRKQVPVSVLNKIYVQTPKFNPKLIIRQPTIITGMQNQLVKHELTKQNIYCKDKLDEILGNFYILADENNILNNIKYKMVMGIKLEASGRLTKRFVAQRAVYKYRYIGGIKNIDSSYKGLSSSMLRNKLRSNIQFSKLASTRRTGAFGLKGWIGGI